MSIEPKSITLSSVTLESINKGTICFLLKKCDTTDAIRSIDLSETSPLDDPLGFQYEIDVSPAFPKKRDQLTCIFPNHKLEKRRVVKSDKYWYTTSFNSDMNDCLNDSLELTELGGTVKLAIAYGKQIYVFKNLTGTVYILWCTVNRKNPGNVPCDIFHNQPILFNLDGQAKLKSAFLLKSEVTHQRDLALLPLRPGNPIYMWPETPIFICETRPPKMELKPLITMSKRQARQRVTARTKDAKNTWLRFERDGLLHTESDILNASTDAESRLIEEADLTTEDASWADVAELDEDLYTPRLGSSSDTPLRLAKVTCKGRGAGGPRNPFDSDNEDEKQATMDEEEDVIRQQVGLLIEEASQQDAMIL
jgi:hypothetical protein